MMLAIIRMFIGFIAILHVKLEIGVVRSLE